MTCILVHAGRNLSTCIPVNFKSCSSAAIVWVIKLPNAVSLIRKDKSRIIFLRTICTFATLFSTFDLNLCAIAS
jgi:hypothetical protein